MTESRPRGLAAPRHPLPPLQRLATHLGLATGLALATVTMYTAPAEAAGTSSSMGSAVVTTTVTPATVTPATVTPAERARRVAFVRTVGELARREQLRSGVPASVIAAQAILESQWGVGRLARAGNNFFGIKCKSWWTGRSVRHRDDDYDANGVLTESCFRAYENVEESFRDHSDFLRESIRYAELFDLDPSDYKGWAHGLKRCGYATDPDYGRKLIGIIERYNLDAFDWADEFEMRWLRAYTEPSDVGPDRDEVAAVLGGGAGDPAVALPAARPASPSAAPAPSTSRTDAVTRTEAVTQSQPTPQPEPAPRTHRRRGAGALVVAVGPAAGS